MAAARSKGLDPAEVKASELGSLIADAVTTMDGRLDEQALQLATGLKRATNILAQLEDREMHRPAGRSAAAFRALVFIWIFGEVPARDLARLSGISRQAVSGVLTSLERDGLIVRTRGVEGDKRVAPIRVTPTGKRYVEKGIRQQNVVESEFLSPLSRDEMKTLTSLLTKLIVGNRHVALPDAVGE